MKAIHLGTMVIGAVTVMIVGCGAADGKDDSSSEQAALGPSTSNAAPANTIMKITPELPSTHSLHIQQDPPPPSEPEASTRRPTATSGAASDGCPVGEHSCEMANDKGICVDRCVPMGVMCVAPNCVVCDPTPPPKDGCKWDAEDCVWLCL